MPVQPFTIEINEQASAGFWGTLLDESGVVIPGNVLLTLQLSLYVVNADGTQTIVNGRDKQNVLNQNDVTVYDTLQVRPDGKTYNLFWQIRVGDTTIVNTALTTERHVALFEWTWPNNHAGKTELWLSIANLTRVP